MRIRTFVSILALGIGLWSAALLADTRIEYKVTEGGGTSANSLLIGQGKVRFDAENTSAIMDPADGGSMTLIEHTKKTFTRITRADLEQMVKMIADLEQQMASMPPQVRQMMAGRMGGAAADRAVTTDTGQKATVAGKSCRIFRTMRGEKATAEYCMADPSAIEISAADRATMASAMAWSKELSEAFAKSPTMGQMADATPFRDGLVPLRTTLIAADGSRKTSEFVGATSGALAAELFAVPAGYKEQKLPTMGRGRGGF